MRVWVIILALTSAALAGTTAYLAHELKQERARQTGVVAQVSPPPGIQQMAPPPARARIAPEATPAEPATAPAAGQTSMAVAGTMSPQDMKKMQQEYNQRLLEQLSTPEGREDMVAQHKIMFRQMYPRIDRVLGLSPEEHSRFLELQALQQVEMQERHARCAVDPACDPRTMWNTTTDSRETQISELLGARNEKFTVYKNTIGEREAVSQLRNRLPDAQRLADDTAESLITALAAEREAMSRDAMQGNSRVSSFGFGAGMLMSTGETFEERYESARQNSERLRERASQYLSAEQMRVFNEMQEETLVSMRAMLRNKDQMGGYSAVAMPVTQ
jgi:hypothetical protein